MNYALDMGSGFIIHVHTKFHQDLFGIQKLLGENTRTDRGAHREQGDLISLLSFFKNKEGRLLAIHKLCVSFIATNFVRNTFSSR
jgi:hypothetical protein